MKTENRRFKIKITFFSGQYKYIYATEKKILKHRNVNKYVFSMYTMYSIKEISVRDLKRKYWDLTYSDFFEKAKNYGYRIEATNKPGYEDLTGYGARTNGVKNRFYIGRSTGFIPIYLEILQKNSMGGASLFTTARKFKVI